MTQQHDIGLKPPAPPYLLEPREEAVVDGQAVTFRWEPVEGALDYRLEVAADTAFTQIVFEKTVAEATTLHVTDAFPPDEATFFWRVFARNAAGETYGEVIESFISGTAEDAARHLQQPDRQEQLGPLPELLSEGVHKAYESWSEADPEAAQEEDLGVQHEGVGVAGILGFVLATLVVIALAIVFVIFYSGVVTQQTREQAAMQLDYPDLREVEARAAAKLTRYEVVNDAEKIYRIPIDQAMELMVNRAYAQPGGDFSPELRLRPGD